VEYEPPFPPPLPVIHVTVDQVQAMLDGSPVPDGTYVVQGTFTVADGVVTEVTA
jgi:hypothetical protein